MADTLINCVMLVKDRARLTNQAIESLVRHTRAAWNLTIVNDASQDDATLAVLDRWYARDPRITVAHNTECQGTGQSRNQGIAIASTHWGRGSHLYLSDNDAYFTKDWDTPLLTALVAYPRFRIVGGYCHPYNGATRTTPLNASHSLTVRYALGLFSWMLTWETWDTYGPLLVNGRGTNQSEDWELCQRVRSHGYEVGSVTPDTTINCGRTDTFGRVCVGSEHIQLREGVLVL